MLIEFRHTSKTYQQNIAVPPGPPPARIQVPFRACPLRPVVELQLDWVATDDVRCIELYKPVMEQRRS